VPRIAWRRVLYGVDPAHELARCLSEITGIEMIDALAAAVAGPRHAGRGRDERPPPVFRRRRRVPAGAMLVDDVVTTGTTLVAAARHLGVAGVGAVTATSRGLPLKSKGSLVEIVP
jgi:predicted amidophosphoribosyltransferase